MASPDHIKVLLVEDNPGDARLTQLLLEDVASIAFDVVHVDRLSAALEAVSEQQFDIALLDLSLPDAHGLEGVEQMQKKVDRLPIVVISGLDDEATSVEAVQKGAQDYLVKGQGDGELIARSIRYAIERKRVEWMLLKAKEKAEHANRAKSNFLATMSHELRSPLNAIIGFSEMMKDQVVGPVGNAAYIEYADHIHSSGTHLLEIINDMLDLAKVEAGTAQLCEELIDIAEIFDATARMIEWRAEESGTALDTEIADDLPALSADRLKLQQVLMNLLSNAVKFTPAGGRIVFAACLDADGELLLTVSDNGIGIAPEDIPKALAPFQQIDSSLSRKYDGTGLGLPLAKSFVELHDGDLTLESVAGTGTRVVVRFPAERLVALEDVKAQA